ncbi:MAG: hypothetical protein Q8911_00235 [Bacillota bacterium]|nr:hypothetical protein [Bacillota bacterium]
MNNPANEISLSAKKAGLSYWSYMAKKYPNRVQSYIWAPKAKKLTRKERSEIMGDILSRMHGKMGLKFLSGIRNLISGRGAY